MDRVNVCISAVSALKSTICFIFTGLDKERKCDAIYLIHKNLIIFGKSAEIHLELCKLVLNHWQADPYPAMHSVTKSHLLVARACLWTSSLWAELRDLTRVKLTLIVHPTTATRAIPWSTVCFTIPFVWQHHRKSSAGCRRGSPKAGRFLEMTTS